jgi:8-hydroxy-5-deazaflavin:NADPH oxidoreductase
VTASATVTSGEGTSGEGTSGEGTSGEGSMQIGVLGGTGPAGSALAARIASVGVDVVVGSRNQERAAATVAELTKRWGDIGSAISPGTNVEAAGADLVVVATPWEGAVSTVKELRAELAGKIVVSMVNVMTRWGDRFVPLLPPTGSVAVAIAEALPESRVAGAFHHLPAGPLGDPDHELSADVMVFSGQRRVTDEVIELVNRVPGLRGIDVGGLGSAMAVEALTAALVEVNRRYKVHTSLRLTGIG